MSRPETVCIGGCGPLGVALGLALGALGRRRVGWDRDPARSREALDAGAIDEVTPFPQDHMGPGALVLLTDPDEATLARFGRAYGPSLGPGALVIDLAPVKAISMTALAGLPEGVRHIPARLPAGASAGLDGQPVWLVGAPEDDGAREAEALFRAMGALPRWIDASEHDLAMAATEQSAWLVAVALMTALDELTEGFPGLEGLPSPALAAATGALGQDVDEALATLEANRGMALAALSRVSSTLTDLHRWLDLRQSDLAHEAIRRAHRRRAALLDLEEEP